MIVFLSKLPTFLKSFAGKGFPQYFLKYKACSLQLFMAFKLISKDPDVEGHLC